MADSKPKTTQKRPKRKLKAAPTFREHAAQQDAKSNKPTRRKRVVGSKLFAPVRLVGRLIKKLLKAIAASRLAQLLVAIYKSRVFTPIRFIVKIIGKILLISYFVNAWKEVKLVTWPDNRTTWRLTGAVLVFAIIFGLLVAGLDFALEKGFREVLIG